jgi:hypothetical protein
MRQITKDSVNAFLNRKTFSRQNMGVKYCNEKFYLTLHGNIIAILYKDDTIQITNCGWFTPTTKERLNALPNVDIRQKNFKWYLNGKEWSGELTPIN